VTRRVSCQSLRRRVGTSPRRLRGFEPSWSDSPRRLTDPVHDGRARNRPGSDRGPRRSRTTRPSTECPRVQGLVCGEADREGPRRVAVPIPESDTHPPQAGTREDAIGPVVTFETSTPPRTAVARAPASDPPPAPKTRPEICPRGVAGLPDELLGLRRRGTCDLRDDDADVSSPHPDTTRRFRGGHVRDVPPGRYPNADRRRVVRIRPVRLDNDRMRTGGTIREARETMEWPR